MSRGPKQRRGHVKTSGLKRVEGLAQQCRTPVQKSIENTVATSPC